MQEKLSVDNYLEVAADNGKTRTTVRITSKTKRQNLLEEGVALKLVRGSLFLASWEDVALDQAFTKKICTELGNDIDELFKAHPEFNQAQRLWIMSCYANSSLFDGGEENTVTE